MFGEELKVLHSRQEQVFTGLLAIYCFKRNATSGSWGAAATYYVKCTSIVMFLWTAGSSSAAVFEVSSLLTYVRWKCRQWVLAFFQLMEIHARQILFRMVKS